MDDCTSKAEQSEAQNISWESAVQLDWAIEQNFLKPKKKPITTVTPELQAVRNSGNQMHTTQTEPIAWSVAVQTDPSLKDTSLSLITQATQSSVSFQANSMTVDLNIVESQALHTNDSSNDDPEEEVLFSPLYVISILGIIIKVLNVVFKVDTLFLRELLFASLFVFIPPSFVYYSDEILRWMDLKWKKFVQSDDQQ